ncbi:MAG: type II toxin-antitoxin system HicB family antitoxin [Chloroflexi bacterium]|nr:type II toxin-antitoxin system HicB family antitoxin [Chloroflexota bacterium]
MLVSRVKVFSLSRYIEAALNLAEYERDEDGMIVAGVPGVSGFFTQGETYEEARANLEDVVEGNVILALQLGWDIPRLPGVEIY